MKRNKLTGWRDVYAFSLTQTMKGKTFLVTTIIFCLISLLALPITQLIGSDSKEEKPIESVENIRIVDESGLGIASYEDILKEKGFEKLTITMETKSAKDISKELEKANKKNKDVLLHIEMQNGMFAMSLVRGANSGTERDDVKRIGAVAQKVFEEQRMLALSITEEQLASIQTPVENEVVMMKDVGKEDAKDGAKPITQGQYSVILSGICLLIFIVAFSGESIASSIITEKSSKVIEYLLTSIRPLAIIVGKILAALTVVITQFALMGVCLVASVLAVAPSMGVETETVMKAVREITDAGSMSALTPANIIISVIIMLGGVLFYGTLAGLAGATVSRVEEMAEGLKVYNFVMIVGAYLGIGLGIMKVSAGDGGVFEKVVNLLPISSPFVIPGSLLTGTTTFGTALLSLGVLVVSLILVMLFVGRVYESMILHNGNRLKARDLIGFAKSGKGATE